MPKKDKNSANLHSLTKPVKLSATCRWIAGGILLLISSVLVFLWMCAKGHLDPAMVLGICGFKQQYQLPCMGCGITTSAIAFVSGDVLGAFYIQPAGAILCCGAVLLWGLSLLIAGFGIDFGLLEKIVWGRIWKYLLVGLIVVFAGGWAVTLARALAN